MEVAHTIVSNTGVLDLDTASKRLQKVVRRTPLQRNEHLSSKYDCNVYLKREDLQIVRSYKLRGAYNLLSSLSPAQLANGVVCASAGNHAQGFAFSCKALNIRGVVFMPVITPKQKIDQTKMFGGDHIEIKLVGDTYDDCAAAACNYTHEHAMRFIPAFDHIKVIEGQGTVGIEILEELTDIDLLFIPVGGGGLAAGVGSYCRTFSPATTIIGVEPAGAASMTAALAAGHPVMLNDIDRFVDGAAVKKVGAITYEICKDVLHEMQVVDEGRVCSTILSLYTKDAIVVEPAGALSVAALEDNKERIRGKNVVCIISGSNNDIDRLPEIKERSLAYEGLKHYFLISFAQRPGALKHFVNHVLGPSDDITRFEYIHKTHKEKGPALVGIELGHKNDHTALLQRMDQYHIDYSEISKQDKLYGYLI